MRLNLAAPTAFGPTIFSAVWTCSSGCGGMATIPSFANGTSTSVMSSFRDLPPSQPGCLFSIGGSSVDGAPLTGNIHEAVLFFSTIGAVNRSIVECTVGARWCVQLSTCEPLPSRCLRCPPGSSSFNSSKCSLCREGTFSPGGSANCTVCDAGKFASTAGSASCTQCPGGHYCPAGTSSWARLNCGRGNYCPDGSDSPTTCPFQVPPTGGWGDLQVQGPAFLVETAHCLNHCFWNSTSGDGMLSKC